MFIPYVNRIDLLRKAIESASDVRDHLVIIDNSKDGLEGEHGWPTIIHPPVPLSFAQTQNWMLKLAEGSGSTFYLFLHSDAEAGQGVVKKIIDMTNALIKEGHKWGVIFTAYDALAVFNTTAFREVGGWDSFLEWYHSDTDMYRRLRLAGYELVESNLPVKHTPSSTLNSDPEIAMKVNLMFPCRVAYYREKWGGDAGNERFDRPFGGK
jgi:hypothetical protein